MLALATVLGACASAPIDDEEQRMTRAGLGGRWVPVKAEAPNGVGTYEGLGGEGCSGGLKPGTKQLGDQLKGQFEFKTYGGYACRANTANKSKLSIHAVGRALDIMVTGARGDSIANHLVKNASELGVQLIIWNRTVWQVGSSGAKSKQYSGPNPHTDHVHVEVTRETATSGPGEASPGETTPGTGLNGGEDDLGAGTGAGTEPDFDQGMAECRTAKDCDPSGAIACRQGFCEGGHLDVDEGTAECARATDCDPSGSMACVEGFCELTCTEQLFRMGICE